MTPGHAIFDKTVRPPLAMVGPVCQKGNPHRLRPGFTLVGQRPGRQRGFLVGRLDKTLGEFSETAPAGLYVSGQGPVIGRGLQVPLPPRRSIAGVILR